MGWFTKTCGAVRRRQQTVKHNGKYQVIKTVTRCNLPKGHKGSHVFS